MADGSELGSGPASVSHDVVTIPNILTFGRICLVPVGVWLVLREDYAAAAGLFVIAGLTDAFDGWLARRRGITTIGTLLDPLADKLLLISMFVALAGVGLLPIWLAILVVFRDLLIVGGIGLLRLIGSPITVRPLIVSKINTAAQIVLVAAALAERGFHVHPPYLRPALVAVVAVTTLISGAAYVLRGVRLA